MNKHKKNLLISSGVASIALLLTLLTYLEIVYPIEVYESQKFLDECEMMGKTCWVEHNSFIPLAMAIIPFMIFMIVYHKLQEKDQHKAWRSYR